MVSPPLWQQTVTYGAIGGTKAADLMTFPPPGFRPFEQRSRIGHGNARWEYACQAVLSWGVQRNSGMQVRVLQSPPHVTEGTYTPVAFESDGTPIAPEQAEGEVVYGAGGERFVAPGDSAILVLHVGPVPFRVPCRVIYLVDEPDRKGFAYGTLPGHPEEGEEAFIVDRTDDGSVWLTIRAFSRPSGWQWWALYPFLRLAQAAYTRRYFRSLSEPLV